MRKELRESIAQVNKRLKCVIVGICHGVCNRSWDLNGLGKAVNLTTQNCIILKISDGWEEAVVVGKDLLGERADLSICGEIAEDLLWGKRD